MKASWTWLLSIGVAFFLVSSGAARADAVLFDGVFNDADWTHSIITQINDNTFTTAQVASGGNPGTYQGGSHDLGLIPPNFISLAHLYVAGGTYDPSTQGAIASITFSYNFIVRSLINAGPLVGHGLLLNQNGVFYLFVNPSAVLGQGWTAYNGILTSADFARLGGVGALLPDFGATGAPISFGYNSLNGYPAGGNGPSQLVWGIDNYSVMVTTAIPNPVPEPSALILVASALAILGVFRRRAQSATSLPLAHGPPR